MKINISGTSKNGPDSVKLMKKASHNSVYSDSESEIQLLIHKLEVYLKQKEAAEEALILERNLSEEAFIEISFRFQNLGDRLPGYFAYINAETLKYEFANSQFAELMNIPGEKIIGSHVKDIIGEKNYQLTLDYLNRARGGESVSYEKSFIIGSDERWFKTDISPVYNTRGNLISVATLSTDITLIKKSEELVNSTSRRLELALNSSKSGAWDWDITTGKIVWSDKMFELFGLNPAKSLASFDTWRGALHPDDLESAEERINGAIKEHMYLDSDYRIIYPDGQIHWINTTGESIYNDKGIAVGMFGICHDITHRKVIETELKARMEELEKANMELEQFAFANQELKQFAYIASHQLQEPIRTVSNYMKIIEEDYSPILDQNALGFIHIVKDATERMSILINSLLDFSRLGRDKVLAYVDSKQLINNVIKDLEYIREESKAIILVGEMPKLCLFHTEFRQLFQNLITNAIKFQKKDNIPVIKINSKNLHNGKWQFSVADNGIGIDPEHFDRMFDIFQRLHATEDQYEGKGIGLAYCKKIVQLHQGEIWIESEVGKGSVFHFTISDRSLKQFQDDPNRVN
jgi:PAS domain S-box-containing protein